jgi:RNA polymerase sigma-70 factor (ECF subfamily)
MDQVAGTDVALLHSYAAGGDARAFAELVRRYSGMVYTTARRVTGDSAAAEDVSQDCFLRLAQSSAAIRGSLAAWLHRTSLNRSLQLLRSERARRLREAQAIPPSRDQSEDAPALIRRVDQALDSLPSEARELITEHFLCGKSQTELALAMGLNQSTVQRRIEKGLAELRRRLRDDDDPQLAMAALPLLLKDLGDATAPVTCCQALTKIGLSGVGGAISARAGAFAAWKIVLLVCALAGIVGSSAYLLRTNNSSGSSAAPIGTIITSLDELPAPVLATFDQLAANSVIREMEKKPDGQIIVYDFDLLIDGRPCEIRISQSGQLIWKKTN